MLTSQIAALVDGEDDGVSVMANVSAAIQEAMGFFWTGFYIEKNGQLSSCPTWNSFRATLRAAVCHGRKSSYPILTACNG